jgi:hypothetical protein
MNNGSVEAGWSRMFEHCININESGLPVFS